MDYINVIKNLSKQFQTVIVLGGVHYDQVDYLIKNAFEKNDKQTHYDWIEKLLLNYYDKMYDYQIEQKKDRCLQSGDWSEIFEFLSNYN